MNPIIGIVACGSTDQRQFVPQTYISAIEDAGGIPVPRKMRHILTMGRSATDSCSVEVMM